jgi:transketolase
MSTGLLGHGLPVGIGMALAGRMDGANYRVYVVLGDGECQAGVVWEAAMAGAKFHLDRLTAILDYNDVQLDGPVHEIMPLEPLVAKWRAFNWNVIEINGHDVRQVLEALDLAAEVHSGPSIIIAHTTKGKGVSFMENRSQWHGAAPTKAQLEQALDELGRPASRGRG